MQKKPEWRGHKTLPTQATEVSNGEQKTEERPSESCQLITLGVAIIIVINC